MSSSSSKRTDTDRINFIERHARGHGGWFDWVARGRGVEILQFGVSGRTCREALDKAMDKEESDK